MKKRHVISLIAVLLVAVSVLAMSTMATPAGVFQVGWDEITISPTSKHITEWAKECREKGISIDVVPDYDLADFGLGGYGDTAQRHIQLLDEKDVWANCIAATDEYDNTVLFISIDIINSAYYLVYHARPVISKATGVPEKNIMFSASHTHSSIALPEGASIYSAMKSYASQVVPGYNDKEDKTIKNQIDAEINALSNRAERMRFADEYFGDTEVYADYIQAEKDYWYRDEFLLNRLVFLCEGAMEDRNDVINMSVGEVAINEETIKQCVTDEYIKKEKDLNFVRHHWYSNGTKHVAVGDNHDVGAKGLTYDKSTSEYQDDKMQLVRFDIKDRERPVVMLKWTAHPCLTGSVNRDLKNMYYKLSGDYIAYLRHAMFLKGYDMSFFQGAAGNVNAYMRGQTETYKNKTIKGELWDGVQVYGESLAEIASYTLDNFTKDNVIPTGLIQVDVDYYPADKFDHSDSAHGASLYNVATQVRNTWTALKKEITNGTYTNLQTRQLAVDIALNQKAELNGIGAYPVHSVYHAGTIISNYEAINNETFDNVQNITTNAVSIGTQWSMITAPGEVYDVLYMKLQDTMKEEYPNKNVFTVAYSNSKVGYIPARFAYEAKFGGTTEGYEEYLTHYDINDGTKYAFCTYETDTTPLAAGSGEAMIEHQIQMLKKQDAIARGMTEDPEHFYCECAKTMPEGHGCTFVEWQEWPSTDSLPTVEGNYYLSNDVSLNSQYLIHPEVTIRLDLRGKTVTQTMVDAAGEVCVYTTYTTGDVETGKNRTLVITDTVGGGSIVGSNGNVRQGGIIRGVHIDMRMYAGTLDASQSNCVHRYGGAAIYIGYDSTFKMYGGTILGGTSMGYNESKYPDNPSEGGAVAVASGKMYMYGGEITGGRSNLGGGIYIDSGAKLFLYGDSKVIDNYGDEGMTVANNIYLENATSLTVDKSFKGECGITVSGGNESGAAFGTINGYTGTGILKADGSPCLSAEISGTSLVWELQPANYHVFDSEGKVDNGALYLSDALKLCAKDGSQYVRLSQDVTENVEVVHDAYLDLAGFDISGDITIADGANLYCLDSSTDDFDCSDGYGKITGKVTGKLPDYAKFGVIEGEGDNAETKNYTYLLIEESGNVYSYHRVYLRVNYMYLQSEREGVYYSSVFSGDQLVAENLYSYGMAFSVTGEPTKDTMRSRTYTASSANFYAGETDEDQMTSLPSVLITDIVKPDLPFIINADRAEMDIYGAAYIKTKSGAVAFGDAVSKSMRWVTEAIDREWDDKVQNEPGFDDEIIRMVGLYNKYKIFMKNWDIPHLKAAAAN